MAFCYINPGYADLLDVSGGTTVTGDQYNPCGGVSFWQNDMDSGIILPEVPTEIYIKVMVRLRRSEMEYGSLNLLVRAGNSNGFGIRMSSSVTAIDVTCNNSTFTNFNRAKSGILVDGINEFLYHGIAGSASTGMVSLILNGTELCHVNRYLTFRQTDSYASAADRVVLYSSNAYGLISNVVVSDSEVAWDEKVAVLSAGSTETDMTDNGDGTYTAETAGQYWLETLDASALIREAGGTSQVKGIALRADPAYRTGSGVGSLISCGRIGGVVEEYETKPLGTAADGKVMSCRRLSGITLNGLADHQYGWKAGV